MGDFVEQEKQLLVVAWMGGGMVDVTAWTPGRMEGVRLAAASSFRPPGEGMCVPGDLAEWEGKGSEGQHSLQGSQLGWPRSWGAASWLHFSLCPILLTAPSLHRRPPLINIPCPQICHSVSLQRTQPRAVSQAFSSVQWSRNEKEQAPG